MGALSFGIRYSDEFSIPKRELLTPMLHNHGPRQLVPCGDYDYDYDYY
jgi:hypothetical protein